MQGFFPERYKTAALAEQPAFSVVAEQAVGRQAGWVFAGEAKLAWVVSAELALEPEQGSTAV